jgi:hypothetical protein
MRRRGNRMRWIGVGFGLLCACSDGYVAPAAPIATTAPAASPTATEAPVLAGAPAEFYGVLGTRIAAFDSVTGRRLRWLTDPGSGHADDRPAVVEASDGTYVAFVRSPAGQGCGSAVLRVPAGGGREETLLDLRDADVTGLGIDRSGATLAYAYTRCGTDDSHTYLRVVDVATKRTLTEAWSSFEGNGVVTVCCLAVEGSRVVVHAGIHLTNWLAVLDVRPGQGRVDVDTLPRLPFEDGCRPSNAVWSGGDVVTVMSCAREGGEEQRLVRFAPPFREAREEPLPGTYELTGSDGDGRFVGTRSSAGEATNVVQRDATGERVLGTCPTPDPVADACVRTPVW